jgi:hypothetical protein
MADDAGGLAAALRSDPAPRQRVRCEDLEQGRRFEGAEIRGARVRTRAPAGDGCEEKQSGAASEQRITPSGLGQSVTVNLDPWESIIRPVIESMAAKIGCGTDLADRWCRNPRRDRR